MAHDLLFGRTQRNWSRGSSLPPSLMPPSPSDEVTLRLTDVEMRQLADLAALKVMADAGDRTAKKKVAQAARQVAVLQKKASRGDVKAARTLRVLVESGVFRPSMTVSLGEDTTLVHNTAYRTAVYKQAHKLGAGAPTTKDFWRAKKAVDGVMSRSGLSVYLPGSRPGRLTI